MLVAAILLLIAISWALWLFADSFQTAKGKLIYLLAVLFSVVSSYGLYIQLGAQKPIQQLAIKHQELHQQSLEELAALVSDKTISVNDLLNELRLRLEAKPTDSSAWMKLGELLILSTQSDASGEMSAQESESMLQLAKQAFNRASQLGNQNQQITNRVEVAKIYVTYGDFDKALEQLNLVLLKNNRHEGALMMKGLTESRLKNHQAAIDNWSYLLSRRVKDSESAQLINSLIAKEQQKLQAIQTQYIEISIDNFANLDLHSFTKAFALVRPVIGGAPIAVKAVDIHELTSRLKITPDDLMLADANMWQAIDLKVEIRLSKSGFAKPETGDLYGQSASIKGLTPQQKFHISIDKVVN